MIENSVCIFGEQFEHVLVPGDEMTRKLIRVEDLARAQPDADAGVQQ